jgi:alkaline phosphatase
MKLKTFFTLFLLCIMIVASLSFTLNQQQKPQRVVIMIGDGMGLAQISGAMSHYKGKNAFERFPYVGLIRTHSADDYVTDSGAGATAFSIGKRSYNNSIGVDADSVSQPTIFELVKKHLGWSTGIVSTSSIVHATPASFYAHVKHRRLYDDIALFLLADNCDIAIGGGYKYFEQRKDKRSILNELNKKGYQTHADSTSWKKIEADKLVYLYAYDGLPRILDGRGDFLSKATLLAISNLSRNKKGSMLMVEGSQIDWGGHDMDYRYMETELWDFNDAINQVLDWAEKEGDVLVIVTADHETGGLTLNENKSNKSTFIPTYSYSHHTGVMVPVFAYGPGSQIFSGVYNNVDIFHKLLSVIDIPHK